MSRRNGNNPKRRIAPVDYKPQNDRKALASRLQYTGSAVHKAHPGNYGFHPPCNPRPWKSICDGTRAILRSEAEQLFQAGILKGMFSEFSETDNPKYIWSVDEQGEAYEAKVDRNGYHGYRLENEDRMREVVLNEWSRR